MLRHEIFEQLPVLVTEAIQKKKLRPRKSGGRFDSYEEKQISPGVFTLSLVVGEHLLPVVDALLSHIKHKAIVEDEKAEKMKTHPGIYEIHLTYHPVLAGCSEKQEATPVVSDDCVPSQSPTSEVQELPQSPKKKVQKRSPRFLEDLHTD